MKIKEVINELELEVIVQGDLDCEVTGGYACDLLSNVMARAKAGDLWLTVQGHQNIVAIALLTDLAGIIITEDFNIDDDTVTKAQEKKVNLLRSSLSTYQLVGRLYSLGIK